MRIVAVDPGGVTGIAYADFYGKVQDVFLSWEQANQLEAVHDVDRLLTDDNDVRLVVCEAFVPRPGVRTWQPEPVEITGALRYVLWHSGIQFITQTPSDAKRFATNEKLEKIGWRYPSPGGHRDDAARHLYLAAVRRGLIDLTPEEERAV